MSDTTTPHVVNEEHVALGDKALSMARRLLREVVVCAAAYTLGSGFWITAILYVVFSLIALVVDWLVGAKLQARIPAVHVETVGRVIAKPTHWLTNLLPKKAVA